MARIIINAVRGLSEKSYEGTDVGGGGSLDSNPDLKYVRKSFAALGAQWSWNSFQRWNGRDVI